MEDARKTILASHHMYGVEHMLAWIDPFLMHYVWLDMVPQLGPPGHFGLAVQDGCVLVWKEISGLKGTTQYKIVVEIYEMFLQSGDLPHHCLDTYGVKGGQVLLVTTEDSLVVHDFNRDGTRDMWILSVGDDVYLVYPGDELVYGAYTPVYLAYVGVSGCPCNAICAEDIAVAGISCSLGIKYRIVTVNPGDDCVYFHVFFFSICCVTTAIFLAGVVLFLRASSNITV